MQDPTNKHALVLTARDAAGSGLRLTYRWEDDRYAHDIAWFDGQRSVLLLTSIEGDGQMHWPPSPPLQQGSLQELTNEAAVGLLLGMAGRSHWSVAAETHSGHPMAIVMDIACRISGEPQWLGSSYRTLRPAALIADDTVQISIDDRTFLFLTIDTLSEAPPAVLRCESDRICIAAATSVGEGRSTIRWRIRLSSDPPV